MSTAYESTTSRNTRSLSFDDDGWEGKSTKNGKRGGRLKKNRNENVAAKIMCMRGCHNQPIIHVATSMTSSAVIYECWWEARRERNASRPRVTRGVPAFGATSASLAAGAT